jgi:heterotetrameric sarcosine oxidase delta subunit
LTRCSEWRRCSARCRTDRGTRTTLTASDGKAAAEDWTQLRLALRNGTFVAAFPCRRSVAAGIAAIGTARADQRIHDLPVPHTPMSFLLSCPHCGQREHEEFRYGGALRAAPADPDDRRAWSEYLYSRDNRAGVQQEWWFHQSGCRQWFVVERDVRTNEVARAYLYGRGEALSE